VDTYRNDENLRLGTTYRPWLPATTFRFPGDDHGSFARATLRCVGVGKCRRQAGGVMCPSYMATREEMHSTRGRAHLLFELFSGGVLERRWREPHVREALDLCLACKGCKGECPVNVDMATYKAEFLSHYYRRRLRPPSAYAFGLIAWWAAIAARMPRTANALVGTRPIGAIAKGLAGIAPERSIPRFAEETFVRWFRHRPPRATGERKVVLWPDTFNDHFFPATAKAAVTVLEDAGFDVALPRRRLCCGRPLYDFGMLGLAQRWLRRILDTLRPEIEAGVPIVVLEPSCAAVFRDELLGLFPDDLDARRLSSQTYVLSELLDSVGYRPPRLARSALVQGHCHHRSVLRFDAEKSMLDRLGLDCHILDAGCCGMAGAFGFERAHYDVSMRIGELAVLPAVRAAGPDTLIVADGFSCREQIEQATGRETHHLAEILEMAIVADRANPQRNAFQSRSPAERGGDAATPPPPGHSIPWG